MEVNNINELQAKLKQIKTKLSLEKQCLFSLGSIQNYLNYFDYIKHYRDDVLKLLMEYFQVMESVDYDIDKEGSKQIGIDYIMKIGYYYNAEAGFKMRMKLDFAIFWGAAG